MRTALTPRYEKAEKQFLELAGVDTDPARRDTVSDLVYLAQFELDLYASGASELSNPQVSAVQKFVKRWS